MLYQIILGLYRSLMIVDWQHLVLQLYFIQLAMEQ